MNGEGDATAVTVYYAGDTPICRELNQRVQWLYAPPGIATISPEDARAVARCLLRAADECDTARRRASSPPSPAGTDERGENR